ncbi:class I SAM-dependent methyltransferase [Wenzhouxiangella sp. XN79A]|uniref:class I SAM-dependent methyltransferase n=1 Tax=Wenzhouxiangella sp. XN79A TaxID=2724193 RepID=UPI00144A5ADF|nr:class I SAM-dependent methyltransferase [Wenzhouxiangella sp. XN79A]NKI34349.1 class I SAM-dependent methyltransferase [Wenzhouxiangella sp. XN79A]
MSLEAAVVTRDAEAFGVVCLDIRAAAVFDVDAHLRITRPDGTVEDRHLGGAGIDPAWLPRGRYRLELPSDPEWPIGTQLDVGISLGAPTGRTALDRVTFEVSTRADHASGWRLGSYAGSPSIEKLSWSQGPSSWFYRHFDHAARVVIDLMFADHPKLRGDVLDVGCGDGITDLGIALRKQPKRFVAVDPFKGYERLPEICKEHHLPPEVIEQSGIDFRPDSGNALDLEDDSFDAVLSWGSLEHIAGGYAQTLSEIKRVLRPGGLFFAHPGLFYGSAGNHLGEFFDDPWIHLKLDREELKERVLAGTPRYMDRAGETSPPEQYWQWYTELNPIKLPDFEQELRGMGFEPWRFALRTDPVVEYTPELQGYDMVALGISELYGVFRLR